jgi:hypothetical protein
MLTRIFRRRSFVLALAGALLALLVLGTASAQTGSYRPGQIFVGVGGGIIRVFDANGTQIGDLDTQTSSGENADMCFADGAMYSMNFTDQSISKFDGAGNLIESRWATIPGALESCVLDSAGDLYVGEDSDTGGNLVKLDSTGAVVQTYTPDRDGSGVDQIDLAADQCTMYYTSESGNVKRFDVCHNQQLPNFNDSSVSLGDTCYGLRIRPNGEVLVACDLVVLRLASDGTIRQRYEPADISSSAGGLFALNLDNDDKHFFTATYQEGRIWRIDIDSGAGTATPYLTTTIAGESIGGLAVFGEISVAVTHADSSRPEIVAGVPDPTEVSTDPGVVGTNIVLAIVATIVILLSSQIFNETIQENNSEIEGWVKRYVRPLAAPFNGLRSTWRSAFTGNPRNSRIAAIGVVLGATGLVYGFLEPGFKLNKDGILLLISVIVALGTITYVYSGMEARVTERRYNLPSGVRVYPVAFGIAVASVAVSRIVNFQPGIIYGFVASSVVLGAGELDRRQKGQTVFIAALCLLATFGLAWAVMIPAREWAQHDANVLSVIFESSSTLIVVGAIESLTFSLVPIEFTHGIKIYRYNRVLWFLMALSSAFLFWHVLIVQKNAGFEAIGKQGTIGALAALAVCVGLTASVWGFFYYRRQQAAKAEALASAPAVGPAEPEPAATTLGSSPAAPAEEPNEATSGPPAEPAPDGEPPPLTRDP